MILKVLTILGLQPVGVWGQNMSKIVGICCPSDDHIEKMGGGTECSISGHGVFAPCPIWSSRLGSTGFYVGWRRWNMFLVVLWYCCGLRPPKMCQILDMILCPIGISFKVLTVPDGLYRWRWRRIAMISINWELGFRFRQNLIMVQKWERPSMCHESLKESLELFKCSLCSNYTKSYLPCTLWVICKICSRKQVYSLFSLKPVYNFFLWIFKVLENEVCELPDIWFVLDIPRTDCILQLTAPYSNNCNFVCRNCFTGINGKDVHGSPSTCRNFEKWGIFLAYQAV